MSDFNGRRKSLARPRIASVVGTPNGSGLLAITFPVQFGAVPAVVACPGDSASGLGMVIVQPATVTVSGFTVLCLSTAGAAVSTAVRVNYIAMIGA